MNKSYCIFFSYRTVKINDQFSNNHELAHYDVTLTTPRPEGYSEDLRVTKTTKDKGKMDDLF